MFKTPILQSYVGKRVLKYSSETSISVVPFSPNASFPRYNSQIEINGPKGNLLLPIPDFINLSTTVALPKSQAVLAIQDPFNTAQKSLWGTTNTLLSNMIQGVEEGFMIPIKLVGVGYRAALEDGKLVMKLGFAHSVILDVPKNIKVTIPVPQRIILEGIDLAKITQFAAFIRNYRKPEPYNQKGIFVGDETIKKKEGKKR